MIAPRPSFGDAAGQVRGLSNAHDPGHDRLEFVRASGAVNPARFVEPAQDQVAGQIVGHVAAQTFAALDAFAGRDAREVVPQVVETPAIVVEGVVPRLAVVELRGLRGGGGGENGQGGGDDETHSGLLSGGVCEYSALPDGVREVPLTQVGFVALVDGRDYDMVTEHNWRPAPNGRNVYARNTRGRIPGPAQFMHRLILNAAPGQIVDHINGNTLDNRRSNLRVVAPRWNTVNSRARTAIGLKGVYDQQGVWRARIFYSRHQSESLGQSHCAIAAALRYDEAAKRHYGEFARLNFPDGVSVARMIELGVRRDIVDAYIRGTP